MKAQVTVKTSIEDRGVSKLAELAELMESVMHVANFDLEESVSRRAVFKGVTDLSLAVFTSRLYSSPLKGLIRDVSYVSNQSAADFYGIPAQQQVPTFGDPDLDPDVTG